MRRETDIVLVGPICAGKSTLAASLSRCGYTPVRAREVIEAHAGRQGLSRAELGTVGADLETKTGGGWLADAVVAGERPAVVDAVRSITQLEAIGAQLGELVVVHLAAGRTERERRFYARADVSDTDVDFEELANTALEREVERLAGLADLAVDTDNLTPHDIVALVLRHVGRT